MKKWILVAMVGVLTLTSSGCGPSREAKIAEAKKQVDDAFAEQQRALDIQIDDAAAVALFRHDADGGDRRYLAFHKCREEPPTQEANKKTCAALQKLIADKEQKDKMQQAKEKAAW